MSIEDKTKKINLGRLMQGGSSQRVKMTKVCGYLIILGAFINFALDIFDGNGIDFQRHFDTIMAALGGAGLIRLRSAIEKIEG